METTKVTINHNNSIHTDIKKGTENMKDESKDYVKHFPWKARECHGCKISTKLMDNERYCDKCKDAIRSMPIKIANKVRNGEMTTSEALQKSRELKEEVKKAVNMKKTFKKERENRCYDSRQVIDTETFFEKAKLLGTFTSAQIAMEINVTIDTAYKYLNQLHDNGILTREKCGRFMIWHFRGCDQIDEPDEQKRVKFR